MTQLLVSIREEDEILGARQGGASILDIKDPSNGPLGRAPDSVIKKILKCNANKLAVSVALGELWECQSPSSVLYSSVDFYKLGLSRTKDIADLGEKLDSFRENHGILKAQFIVVVYGDFERAHCKTPEDVTLIAIRYGWKGILIDTFCKDGTCLFDWMSIQRIRGLSRIAQEAGLTVGLAGSIKFSDISKVVETGAEILGVRGLVCDGGKRENSVIPERVNLVRKQLDRSDAGFG